MARILIGGKSHRAGFHAQTHQLFHLGNFFRRRLPLHGVFTHDVMAHGDMADQRRRVDPQARAERLQILRRRRPLPRHARFEHAPADRLDADKTFHHRVAIFHPRRGETQAAVADHHGCHAVETRRRAHGIPKKLRVQMGVRIDKTRRHRQAAEVERALGAGVESPDVDDLAVGNANIAMEARQPRAVINPSAFKQKIVHRALLISFASQLSCAHP